MFFLVLLDEFFLLFDPVFASHEKEYDQNDYKYEDYDPPDDDVGSYSTQSAPEQEHDHYAQGCTYDADNEDRVLHHFSTS